VPIVGSITLLAALSTLFIATNLAGVGECLPLTHYLRMVRAIMLKGSTLGDLHYDTVTPAGLMLVAMLIAVTRFRRTLD
jgi:ABC-type polysaccharide/polyol phosphate export permease